MNQAPPTPMQPALFSDFERVSLEVAADPERYAGRITSADEGRAFGICKALMSGASLRSVCREFGVDHRRVHAIMDRLASAGRIPTLQQQLQREVDAVALMSWENLASNLASGYKPTVPESVVAGMAFDKRQLLQGAPTAITEERRVDVVALADRLERLKKVAAIDVESIAPASQTSGVKLVSNAHPGSVPDFAPIGAVKQQGEVVQPVRHPSPEPVAAGDARAVLDGGGGDRFVPPGSKATMDSAERKFGQKHHERRRIIHDLGDALVRAVGCRHENNHRPAP